MKKTVSSVCILISVITFIPNSCTSSGAGKGNRSAREFKNYNFSQESSIEDRVKTVPGFVLKYLRELDSRSDYSNYTPGENEMAQVKKYIELQPEFIKSVLKKRLLGIYFINNLIGSALTEWVTDEQNKIFTFIAFNPKTLKTDISSWITYRDETCFIKSKGHSIDIDCGKKFTGFLYALTHESAHVVDYVSHITPYIEDHFMEEGKKRINDNNFIRGIWADISKPVNKNDYRYRNMLSFFGFGNGPKISSSESVEVYRGLSGSPFVSLYGSKTWAEDAADFIFFYHLTQVLKQPYRIKVTRNDKVVYSLEPMKSKQVRRRFPVIKKIFSM